MGVSSFRSLFESRWPFRFIDLESVKATVESPLAPTGSPRSRIKTYGLEPNQATGKNNRCFAEKLTGGTVYFFFVGSRHLAP